MSMYALLRNNPLPTHKEKESAFVSYDRKTHSGRKFNYFSYGAACSEVEIDCLTGDHQVRACSLCVLRYSDLTYGLEHYRTLCKREIYEFAWQCDDPISQATKIIKTK